MQERKIWSLSISTITESDLLWLKGLGVKIKVETLTNQVYLAGQISKVVVTGHRIEIITTCEKQETMLQLKYSKNLHLNSIIFPSDENFNMVSYC
jgi:hypothetical protein